MISLEKSPRRNNKYPQETAVYWLCARRISLRAWSEISSHELLAYMRLAWLFPDPTPWPFDNTPDDDDFWLAGRSLRESALQYDDALRVYRYDVFLLPISHFMGVGVEVGWPWDDDEEKMLRKFLFWRRHWVLRWLRRVWNKVMWDAWEDEIDKWFKRAWKGRDPYAEVD